MKLGVLSGRESINTRYFNRYSESHRTIAVLIKYSLPLLLLLLSCSVVSDSVRPHRQQPTRLLCPWDSLGKNTRVGCHFLLQCIHCMLSHFSCVQLCAILWTAAHQAPPSTGFSRQEYWSRLPFPSPLFSPNHSVNKNNCLISKDHRK